jgi:two-component system nitrate/nitrite sensor histidine kinase NarX
MLNKAHFKPPNWKHLQRSLLLRIGGAIAAIALLAVLGMSVSGLVAESTQGSGEAINRAGSLRMQSWSMASLYLAVPLPPASAAAQRMADAIREFDATLNSPTLRGMLPRSGDTHLAETYQQTQWEWLQSACGPASRRWPMAACPGSTRGSAPNCSTTCAASSTRSMTWSSRWKTPPKPRSWSCAWCWAWRLILTVIVVLLTIWLIHTHLVQPLKGLLALSSSVGQGDLAARTVHTGDDELGQLGRAFNLMAEDLSKLYQDLEARVNQKTAELTRSNQSLELLYHSIARLHGAPPGKTVYLALLRDIEQLLELGHGIICLGEQRWCDWSGGGQHHAAGRWQERCQPLRAVRMSSGATAPTRPVSASPATSIAA